MKDCFASTGSTTFRIGYLRDVEMGLDALGKRVGGGGRGRDATRRRACLFKPWCLTTEERKTNPEFLTVLLRTRPRESATADMWEPSSGSAPTPRIQGVASFGYMGPGHFGAAILDGLKRYVAWVGKGIIAK